MRRLASIGPAVGAALLLAACHSPAQRAAHAAGMAELFANAGDFRSASMEMNRAVQLDEDQPTYWQSLARYDLRLGDVRSAYFAYQHVYELDRSNIEALEWLSELSVAANDVNQAQTYLDALMVLQPNDLRGRIAQGNIALKRDHYDEALRTAEAVLHDDPSAGDAAVLKSQALEKLGHLDQAAAVIEGRVRPGDPGAQAMLARLLDLYTSAGDGAGMRRTYVRMLAIKPDDGKTVLAYARSLAAAGQGDQALKVVGDYGAKHPANADVRVAALGLVRAIKGQAAAHAQALGLAASQPAMRGAVAQFLLETGDPQSARALVAPVVEGQPVTSGNVEAQLAYAGALRALGSAPQARAILDRVIAFDQTDFNALMLRTAIELDAHDLDRALADARIAVDLNQQSDAPQLLLARVYEARGNVLLAQNTYATALNTFPGNVQVLGTYVDFLMRVRAVGQALMVADSFTRANPKVLPGWAVKRQVCAAAGFAGCVRQASDVLAGGKPPSSDPTGTAA